MATWTSIADRAYKELLASSVVNAMLENLRYLKERADVVDNAALGGTRAWQSIPALTGTIPANQTAVSMASANQEYTVASIAITALPAGTYKISAVISAFAGGVIGGYARIRRSTSSTPLLAMRHDLFGTGLAGAHECIYVHTGGDVTFSATIEASGTGAQFQPAGCSLVVARV